MPSLISVYNGSELSRNGETLILSDRKLRNIEIAFTDSTAAITSKDETIENAKITFAAFGEITSVTVNGKAVSCKYADGKVCIGG